MLSEISNINTKYIGSDVAKNGIFQGFSMFITRSVDSGGPVVGNKGQKREREYIIIRPSGFEKLTNKSR